MLLFLEMSGERRQKGQKTRNTFNKNIEKDEVNDAVASEHEEDGFHDNATLASCDAGIRSGLENISKEIRGLKAEIREDFNAFGQSLRSDVKKDLDNLKQDIHQRFTSLSTEQQRQGERLEEAETRLEQLENWALEANDNLLLSLKHQKNLQDKLTDLESRSRRNNIRIYGVAEGEEGESVANFVENLIKRELKLPKDFDLHIQRAHRSLAPKPAVGTVPRPIIVNFLEFSMKERILREVWSKKITMGNKTLSFDHDYATEIVQKRKEYITAKRALKEKGIRFQTPFTKMRIFWDSGTRTYNSAKEVNDELTAHGLMKTAPATTAEDSTPESRLRTAMQWRRNEGARRFSTAAALRAKGKLQEFQRSSDN